MSAYVERRDQRRRQAEAKRMALAAAAATIRKNIADLPGLIANLRIAGGSERLIRAITALPVVKPPEVGGEARPEPVVWNAATAKLVVRR
jgi:hypothetical protein